MTDDVLKVQFTIPQETQTEIDELKKEQFYDKTYADLYRYIFSKGLNAINKGKK